MKQLTDLEKKIRRRIAKASKRGRYLIVTRRGKRSRPGRRKKKIRCDSCGSNLGEYHNHSLCNECMSKQEAKQDYGMNIPKMTKGT